MRTAQGASSTDCPWGWRRVGDVALVLEHERADPVDTARGIGASLEDMLVAARDTTRVDPRLRQALVHPQVLLALCRRHPLEVGLSRLVWNRMLLGPHRLEAWAEPGKRLVVSVTAWRSAALALERRTTARLEEVGRALGHALCRNLWDDRARPDIELRAFLDADMPPSAVGALLEAVGLGRTSTTSLGNRQAHDVGKELNALLEERHHPLVELGGRYPSAVGRLLNPLSAAQQEAVVALAPSWDAGLHRLAEMVRRSLAR